MSSRHEGEGKGETEVARELGDCGDLESDGGREGRGVGGTGGHHLGGVVDSKAWRKRGRDEKRRERRMKRDKEKERVRIREKRKENKNK